MAKNELNMNATSFLLQDPLPEDPMGVANDLGGLVDKELVSGQRTTPTIYVFRGLRGERWDLTGPLPCPIDDVARALAARSDADCVAIVGAIPVPDAIQADATWGITTENQHGRYLRVLALVRGDQQELPDLQVYGARSRDQRTNWIGKEPRVNLDFTDTLTPGVWRGVQPEA